MVNLSYIIHTKAPIEKVWQYFSVFENFTQWDPNVVKVTPVEITPQIIDSTYELTSFFKGGQSIVQYRLTQYDKCSKICYRGENKTTLVIDEVYFREKGDEVEIEYRADISLKGVYWIFTPCIRGELDRMTEQAHSGMKKKCVQLFGNAI